MFRIRPSKSRTFWHSPKNIQPWNQRRCYDRRATKLTSGRIETAEEYPLSIAVAEKLDPLNSAPAPATKRKGTRRAPISVRTQVVSPDLCDDVINYAGHTLEKHRGCDILDINPGVGLWSQKLHEFLQPRSHILLEPNPEKFSDFLTPLLEAPNSKYKLVKGDTCNLDTYTHLVENGVFPDQRRVDPMDPAARKQNNSLLVTGSLIWDPKIPGMGFDSMAKQLYQHFAQAAPNFSLFHSYGPVRTLLWLQNDDFKFFMPKSTFLVSKGGVFLDILGNTTEVVTSGQTPRQSGKNTLGREPQYQINSVIQATKAGRKKGMELPLHRREDLHGFAEDIDKLTGGTRFATSGEMYDYLREQFLAGKNVSGLVTEVSVKAWDADKKLSENPDMFKLDRMTGSKLQKVTAQRKAASTTRASSKRTIRQVEEIEYVTCIGQDVYDLECKILSMEDGAAKDALLEDLKVLEQNFEEAQSKLPAVRSTAVSSSLDDRIALRGEVPHIQWDSRPFEPLVMRPKEAWPRNRLSLVSFESRPPYENRELDWHEWMQDFASAICWKPSMSIHQALEALQSGASEIIDSCPSLKDPKKGGRLNMHQLRVRMLTLEMLDELTAAYREWPFRDPTANHSKHFRLKTGKSK